MDNYYHYNYSNKLEFIDHTVRFPLFRVMDLEGKILAPEYETLSKEHLLKAFNIMCTTRQMDVIYNNAQRQNRITFYMTGTYEEAANLGAISAVKDTDALFFQYREFPMLLWRGVTPLDILNNLKGNKDDMVVGRCLALINTYPDKNIFPGSAPLGNRNPHSAGAGYYFRIKNQDRIAMCVFGEGSASEGDFHSSLNFAATLGAQTLFFCRNNCYAISTFREDQYAGDGIAPRCIGYGIPGIKVDGSDIFAVYHAVKKAREMIMERKGPVLVEAYTYRGGDHSTSDSAASYRTPEVMGRVNKYFDEIGDPIVRLGKYLQSKGYISDYKAEVKAIEDKTKADCMNNLKKIDQVKMPYYMRLFDDVYKELPWNLRKQKKELEEHLKNYGSNYPVEEFSG
jgi:2-oxoisovalerate dehydrogenase E1 component alpha subunit